jgi:hypothetical protein
MSLLRVPKRFSYFNIIGDHRECPFAGALKTQGNRGDTFSTCRLAGLSLQFVLPFRKL